LPELVADVGPQLVIGGGEQLADGPGGLAVAVAVALAVAVATIVAIVRARAAPAASWVRSAAENCAGMRPSTTTAIQVTLR